MTLAYLNSHQRFPIPVHEARLGLLQRQRIVSLKVFLRRKYEASSDPYSLPNNRTRYMRSVSENVQAIWVGTFDETGGGIVKGTQNEKLIHVNDKSKSIDDDVVYVI